MKKKIIAAILAGMMSMSVLSSMAAEESATEKTTETETETEAEEVSFFEELKQQQFVFSSGAGGWATMLNIDAKGQFSGEFFDGEMGVTGEGYPNGTMYQSNFSGQFTEPEQINEYTWSMQIEEIAYEQEVGTEEIIEGVLYSYVEPYGLDGAEDILIYLPGAPLEELPEEFRSWVGYYDLTNTEETELPFYALYNETGQYGFSSYNIVDTMKEMLSNTEEQAAVLEEELKKDTLTQGELNEKTLLLYETWDAALNTIWDALNKLLDEEAMQALTEEELEWIEAKEAAVAEAGAEFAGGSMQPMIMNSEAAEWTEIRVYELMEMLEQDDKSNDD